jgi:hypothetical protein
MIDPKRPKSFQLRWAEALGTAIRTGRPERTIFSGEAETITPTGSREVECERKVLLFTPDGKALTRKVGFK